MPFVRPYEIGLRIVGGIEAAPHSFPWQVLITDGFIMCGAALLDNNWLVTAAHCVQGSPVRLLKAYLGMHNRRIPEDQRVTKYISRIIVVNYEIKLIMFYIKY